MSRFRPIDTPYLLGTRWRVVDALLAVAAGFVAVAVVGTLFFALTGVEPEGVNLLTVTFVVQTLATVFTLLVIARSRGMHPLPAAVGLTWRWRDTWGVGAGVVLQVLVAVVVGGLLQLLPGEPTEQAVVEVTSGAGRGVDVVALILLLGVVAPVVEEVVHRGVLLSRFRRTLSPWPAILASAAVFAGVHLVDPGALYALPGLFLIGIALGWFALATGDLSLPIAVHAGVNLTGVLVITFGEELTEAGGWATLLLG